MNRKTLPSLVSLNIAKNPDAPAIIWSGGELSFSGLAKSSGSLARRLSSLGVKKRERVAIIVNNSPEFVISFFAAASVGAISVPLNPDYKHDELAFYIRDSGPKAIVASSGISPMLKEILKEERSDAFSVITVGHEKPLVAGASEIGPSLDEEAVRLYPRDWALCQYSSGSTGRPKRIIRTHGNLVSEAENFCAATRMTRNDSILCAIPLFHAHGFGNCMLASAYSGATLFIADGFNRFEVLKTIQDRGITVFPAVPFIFKILADTPLREKVDLSSLRLCFSAGAPLPQDVFRKFHEKYGVYIRQLYGSTETGSVTINMDEDISETYDSVGRPAGNVHVEVIGESGAAIKDGGIGEVGIKSPAMSRRSAGPDMTERGSFRKGFFIPGDLGRKDGKGNLYITGRKTLFINSGGNKVDPMELESLIRNHPKVEEVAVVGVKGRCGEEIIKAVIVPKGMCGESEIVEFCRGKIADYKIPRIIEYISEIPKSPLGKILRKYLV